MHDSNDAHQAWSVVIRELGLTSAPLRVALSNASIVDLTHDSAVIRTTARYAQALSRVLPEIARAITNQLGRPIGLRLQTDDPVTSLAAEEAVSTSQTAPEPVGRVGGPSASQTEPSAPLPAFNPNVGLEHPLVKQAMELFGGRIVDVQPRRK